MNKLANLLKSDQVIAYPTEAVFGLGCNPLSQSAVEKLLILKQRPVEKGLILVAPDLDFLLPFIDTKNFTQQHWNRLQGQYDRPTTWLVPVDMAVPKFLTGKFNSIAVRLCHHPAVEQLCHATGFALTSTSANLTGLPPCKTVAEVRSQFGADFPVLEMPVGDAKNPSEIRDLFTNQLVRQG
ncbi:Sua5/YciO/YrdC/YwlC family protein [Lonepinella sp. MS14437]|uniref:Sua5/YciO/YrdC/YwlC family protein n=1 Tax=unclassified Lonepinella TaxID=2642006 RepID=UPI0036DDED1A